MHYIDVATLVLFLLICIVIGLKSSKKVQNLRQFALGYQDLTSTALFCSIISSFVGTGATLGIAEKTYLFGALIIARQLLLPIYWYILSLIIPKAVANLRRCITIGDIMGRFYGPTGRYVTAISSLVTGFGLIMIQGIAMGYMLNYFLGIPSEYGMMIGYSVLISYSMLGGINAVVQTEIFKSIFFFVIVPISYVFASIKTGGFSNIIGTLPGSHIDINFTQDTTLQIMGLIFYSIFPSYDAPLIQRCLMVPDAKKLKKCFNAITLLYIPFSVSFCVIAYLVKTIDPEISSKEVVFYYIENFLPIGLQGLMIAGLLAVMMSFSEAQLSSASVMMVHDIMGNLLGRKITPRTQILLLRVCIFIFGMTSFCFISNFTSSPLLSIAWAAFNFYDPLISIPLTAAFLGMRSNQLTFVSNTVFAIIFLVIGRLYAGEFAITSFCFGILGSAIGFFGMHYLQKHLGSNFEWHREGLSLQQKLLVWKKRVITQLQKSQENIKYKEFIIFILAIYYLFSLYICFVEYNGTLLSMLGIGYIMCLCLMAKHVIFKNNKKLLTAYWNMVVIYCLPVVSSYILLNSNGNDFWLLNGVILASSLSFFVNISKCVIYTLFGALISAIFFTPSYGVSYTSLVGFSYILVFLLSTSIIFLRAKEREQEEAIENMQLFGGAMAHEVKSPLATLNMGAKQLNNMIQSSASTEELSEVGRLINKVTAQGISTVENLLTSLRQTSTTSEECIHTINEVIMEALEEYYQHRKSSQPPIVKLSNNFTFYGSKHFVKHVIDNLLNNAYKHGGRDTQITIQTSNNKLYIKDDGKGIAPEHLPFIFEKFYTKDSRTGTGIGLAFCKMVMEDLGGAIQCSSKPNKLTTFILEFPR